MELWRAAIMKQIVISIAKKEDSVRPNSFSFRRITGRELYQPSQAVEPEGPRVYYRTRRHAMTLAN